MSTGTEYQYHKKPEIWGGIECTINRVEDEFRDQLEYAGHYKRLGDIQQFADLGIRKIRYPVLWEYHEPTEDTEIDWQWSTEQLDLIKMQGITPIAGLLHHGSGPAFTDLLDEEFPGKLAAYAGKVATQFPWLEYYTPVNEPLTTARFSGLYGLWYPHRSSDWEFAKMFINQVKGIVLSMMEIRKVNPSAKLVQTEDLCKVHSTPLLSYQASFENKRRWLTYDLLCGKLDQQHPLWKYFIGKGIKVEALEFFLENACPPDIMGFNYYVTSERYLDENLDNFPRHTHGGNGKHHYADTEAVRVGKTVGLSFLLQEAWDRYGLPMAITECHLNCTREEQLRWFKENWDACCGLCEKGVDIRAVTAWALLGAYDWNSVLTEHNRHYEPGVFDIRNDKLRATSVAKMIRSLANTGTFEHPLVSEKGWWGRQSVSSPGIATYSNVQTPPVLIIGRSGTLGSAFMKICETRHIPYVALTRADVDILNEESIRSVIEKYKPWAIINAAGYVRVDDAELNRDECFAINATAPGLLAKCCHERDIRFMTFSSDLVFDGDKKTPYHEADQVMPLNVYGSSKVEGEKLVLAANPGSLVIRTSAFFGPWDRYNFVYAVLDALEKERPFYMPHDVIVSPTYVPDLANTSMDLFIDEEKGTWHLTNEGLLTWANFAEAIADRSCHKKNTLVAKSLIEMGWQAQRPLYSALESEKGIMMPSIHNALERYFEERAV
ncbi:MAG: sugar nucleotide-binding protein [Chitinophagaceae bacterium]|nr:sugar nucleotide-binding protein [Chitinophagaceae bacterium]